ncbi:MAG TPA: glutaredoxin family protein [Candidatus Micrarchaeaceae archaeon]|nr:glutaredoxin family protein [Candidatus Micrarchaeaceae archaeon]
MKVERVELISRRDCPLCDRAKAALLEVCLALDLGFSEFDVDEDVELAGSFTDRVPVIRYLGQIVAEGRIEPVQLRTALAELKSPGRERPDNSVTATENDHFRS